MDKQRLQNLLIAYSSNKIEPKDYIELMDLVVLSEQDAELQFFMEKVWNSQPVEKPFSELQSDVLYKRIISDQRFSKSVVKKRSVGQLLWQRIAIAAVVLITVSMGLFFYTHRGALPGIEGDAISKHDIKPGGNNAVLTLADGRKIILNDASSGKLDEQGGLSVTKAADGQLVYEVSGKINGKRAEAIGYNTIETPKGGQYQVNLPDGTKVWLNAASSLKFPSDFTSKNKRVVELSGEGYFEVAQLKVTLAGQKAAHKVSFIVKTNNQEVEVLGTHFNISCYPNDMETKTSLLEGAVKVSALSKVIGNKSNMAEVMLKPGQQAVLSAAELSVKNVDAASEAAWKNGYFVFKNEEMRSIMRKIARWYNVEIVFSNDFASRYFEGSISRFKNVSEVLRKFELTGDIHFKIEERRITVMP